MNSQRPDENLTILWTSTIGEAPAPQQFSVWETLHAPDVICRAIIKTAIKNQTMSGMMSQDHRIRFCSKVMNTLTNENAEHAANRERLKAEMEKTQ
jgi:hypothetical protein